MKSKNWFTTKKLFFNVWGIGEFSHPEEVISYLILGDKRALLFDTGLGIKSIKTPIRGITSRPVIVLNSHSHFDHIGGNEEFKKIIIFDHPVMKKLVKRHKIEKLVKNGEIINFPPFKFELIHTPGHSPESICLFEKRLKFLLAGDTLYPGPIYLHLKESNFADYKKSIEKLIKKKPKIIFPGHNGFLMRGETLRKIWQEIEKGICFWKINDKIDLLIKI